MFDAIVVGVGGMGSATLFHLAQRGRNVLGLEQFDIPHELGSSHGVSRIIRLAYAEDPRYVPLLRRSYALWRELEHRAGERLLIITGGVDAGTRHSETIEGSLRSCVEHHLPHELLDADAIQQRFPGYRLASDMFAVYQPDAGFLLPERCIVAHVDAAKKLGAEIHAREAVRQWRVDEGAVTVETDKATYHARKLVITAGAWARPGAQKCVCHGWMIAAAILARPAAHDTVTALSANDTAAVRPHRSPPRPISHVLGESSPTPAARTWSRRLPSRTREALLLGK